MIPKRHLLWIRAALTAAALVWLPGCGRQPVVSASTGAPGRPVNVATPASREQPVRVLISGSVEARETVDVAFQVSGRVRRIYVDEGAFVRVGQILAELDDSEYAAARDAASAQLLAASSGADKARNGARTTELEQVRLTMDQTRDEYQRMKRLFDRGSLPATDFRKFETAFQIASQRYQETQEGARTEDKTAASALADQSRAQLTIASKRLNDARLRSPISGVIARRDVDHGETAAEGRPVFTIVDISSVRVRAGVPESDLGVVRRGARALVRIPSLPGREFPGVVDSVNPSADPASRTYPVRIALANPGGILSAGMVAEAEVVGSQITRILTVPADAVRRDPQGAPIVFLLNPANGRVYSRQVEIGAAAGELVEVRQGVTVTDRVVVSGQHDVGDGERVRAREVRP